MTSESLPIETTDEERAYITLRLFVLVLGFGLYFTGYIPAEQTLQRTLCLWALILTTIGTLFIMFAARSRERTVARATMWILPIDLVAVATFTWVLAPRDVFYGVCVLLVVFAALVQPYRDAVFVSIALSMAYLIGHVFTPYHNVYEFAIIAAQTISLALVGVVVAHAFDRQRRRESVVEGAVLDRERVNEELARRVGELQAVAEITEIIHSSLDFDEIGPVVLDIVSKVIDFPSLAIFVLDKEKSETLFSASVGVPHNGHGPGDPLDLQQVEQHLTCLRVFDHGSVMVLFCSTAEDMDRLSDDDRLVIYALASELVVAVENSRLYKLTRRLAVTDELTGMSNYRHLQQRLDEEVSRARRYGKHLSLLMIDADDFKGFNDTYGHIAGDMALAEFGAVLASIVREVDVVARYGGEEFAIVLPETDAAGAFVVAEKIREALGAHLFPDAEGVRCCNLTVSIGIATFPAYAYDKESLLREADDALYRAKNGGRNRVCAPHRAHDSATTPGEPS